MKKNRTKEQETSGSVSLITIADPNRKVSQTFLDLFDNIQSHYTHKKWIGITSADDQNGKSTVAGNLAIQSALSGNRTLIIDAHFKNPAIAKTFDLLNFNGLSNYLFEDDLSLPSIIQPSYLLDNLDVITIGGAENIESDRLESFISDISPYYDTIIVDMATYNKEILTEQLLKLMDINIIVIRKQKTSTFKVKKALKKLKQYNPSVAIVDNEFI